ncbi:hypothetical protein ATANTOWER_029823 [Ataeniobius toweri]|uniref:Uncharacterized protein n=1 Tax=Ataeniobius toweri TaxID=208326 RepID=A0ABU7B926_9TELE|nr:hypothetical protein [Ataeniobius toweri]
MKFHLRKKPLLPLNIEIIFFCSEGTFKASSDLSAISGKYTETGNQDPQQEALLSLSHRPMCIKAAVSPFHAIPVSSLSSSTWESSRTPFYQIKNICCLHKSPQVRGALEKDVTKKHEALCHRRE